MPNLPQLAHPLSSADMRERRQMPLVRRASSASSQGSRGGRVLKEAESLMKAANLANGIGGQDSILCAITGESEPRLFHAAHVLPHSYWSTARQHEWLFYAGAIPNGNARYRGLEKFKYTEKNILWLAIHLANLMEPMIGEVIVVPQLATIISIAEQRLARYEGNELVFDNFTSPELLAEWLHQVTAREKSAGTFPYSLWITPSRQDTGPYPLLLETIKIRKEGQVSEHTHDATTDLQIPITYDPPLPTYNLCIDPIIASIVAWTTIRNRLLERSLTLADNNTFALLDYFLALCETGKPSEWRSFSRPDVLPAARPPPPAAAAAEEDDRRRVYMAEDWAPPQKKSSSQALMSSSPSKRTHSSDVPGQVWKRSTKTVSEQQRAQENDGEKVDDGSKMVEAAGMGRASNGQDGEQDPPSDPPSDPQSDPSSEEPNTSLETKASSLSSAILFKALPEVSADEKESVAAATRSDDDDDRTPEERWQDHRVRLNHQRHRHKSAARVAERLDDLEDDHIDEARRIVRIAFEERARCDGFSFAMRWLRGSEADALAIDDEVDRIKAKFIKVALPIADAWIHDTDNAKPTHEVIADWLATT